MFFVIRTIILEFQPTISNIDIYYKNKRVTVKITFICIYINTVAVEWENLQRKKFKPKTRTIHFSTTIKVFILIDSWKCVHILLSFKNRQKYPSRLNTEFQKQVLLKRTIEMAF